jgi:hypothetical protein
MEVLNSPAQDWSLIVECSCGSTLKLSATDIQYHTWKEYVCTFESIWPGHSEFEWQRYFKYRAKCPVCKKYMTILERHLSAEVMRLAKSTS